MLIFVHDVWQKLSEAHFIKFFIIALQAEKPFVYSDTVQPICLPPQGFQMPADAGCTVSGWGLTYDISKNSLNLLTIYVEC